MARRRRRNDSERQLRVARCWHRRYGSFEQGAAPDKWTQVTTNNGPWGAGVVGNGSGYGNTDAPDGTQALLLKGYGGAQQTLSGFVPGWTYTLSFYAEGRSSVNNPNPLEVLLGGDNLSFGIHAATGADGTTIIPRDQAYNLYTSDPFQVTTATPVLELLGTIGTLSSQIDNSSYVDLVTVSLVRTPEPASLVVWGIAAAASAARSDPPPPNSLTTSGPSSCSPESPRTGLVSVVPRGQRRPRAGSGGRQFSWFS